MGGLVHIVMKPQVVVNASFEWEDGYKLTLELSGRNDLLFFESIHNVGG